MDAQDNPCCQYTIDIPEDMTKEKYAEIVRDRMAGEVGATVDIGPLTDEEIILSLLNTGQVSDEGIQLLIDEGFIDEWLNARLVSDEGMQLLIDKGFIDEWPAEQSDNQQQ